MQDCHGALWSLGWCGQSMSNGARYKSQSILKSLMLLRSKLSLLDSIFYRIKLGFKWFENHCIIFLTFYEASQQFWKWGSATSKKKRDVKAWHVKTSNWNVISDLREEFRLVNGTSSCQTLSVMPPFKSPKAVMPHHHRLGCELHM